MTEDKKNILDSLAEMSETYNKSMKQWEEQQEVYWNSLTKEQQLDAFCAVSRRIYQAELIDQGTYRHALYGVFGFGPEAYAAAQCAGYLDIHNSINDADHDRRLLEKFCEKNNIEDATKKIDQFIQGEIL